MLKIQTHFMPELRGRAGSLATVGALSGLALLLASCGSPAPEDPAPDEIASGDAAPIPVEPDGGIGDGAGPPADISDDANIAAIPAAMQGRWALVAADCTSVRGDTKGLLTVAAKTLKFYESIATFETVKERGDGSIRAAFAFEGEGMTWKRDISLALQEGGDILMLREYGDDAPPGPMRYTRCA